jgi:hypothetical protein
MEFLTPLAMDAFAMGVTTGCDGDPADFSWRDLGVTAMLPIRPVPRGVRDLDEADPFEVAVPGSGKTTSSSHDWLLFGLKEVDLAFRRGYAEGCRGKRDAAWDGQMFVPPSLSGDGDGSRSVPWIPYLLRGMLGLSHRHDSLSLVNF